MRRQLVLAALVALAAPLAPRAGAQTKDNIIDPGMSKTQVIEHLGQPSSVKTADTALYMFYPNGCLKTCGMNDVVILVHDKVVDAIFRDPNRKYTGESSSPTQITAAEAIKTGKEKHTGSMTVKPPAPPPNAGKAEVMPAPKPVPAPPPPSAAPMGAPSPAPLGDSAPPPVKKDTSTIKPRAAGDTTAYPKPPAR
jgi:hypothetical protein